MIGLRSRRSPARVVAPWLVVLRRWVGLAVTASVARVDTAWLVFGGGAAGEADDAQAEQGESGAGEEDSALAEGGGRANCDDRSDTMGAGAAGVDERAGRTAAPRTAPIAVWSPQAFPEGLSAPALRGQLR